VPCRSRDLSLVFSVQSERAVNRDHTVSFQNHALQLERVGWKATLAGCQVTVHQHLDGTLSLTHGPHVLGRFNARARLWRRPSRRRQGLWKRRGVESQKDDFPTPLGNPANGAGFPLSHSPGHGGLGC